MQLTTNLSTQKSIKLVLQNPVKSNFKVSWKQIDTYQTYKKIIDNVNPLIIGSIQIEIYDCFHPRKQCYQTIELPTNIDLKDYTITQKFIRVTDVYQVRGKHLLITGIKPHGTCWLFDKKMLINGYTFFPTHNQTT